MLYLKRLDEISDLKNSESISEVGGKAIGLAKVLKSGFRVPQTLIIPASIVRKIETEYNERNERKECSECNGYNESKKSNERNECGDRDIFDGVICEICSSFFGVELLAVRSSAAIEDGSQVSFAGQLTSEIGVIVDKKSLRVAIIKCISAKLSPSFRDYCETFGFSADSANLAILVQPVVKAQFAGVAFSVDPASGSQVVLIEATEGTGEKLVAGETDSHQYRIPYDRADSFSFADLPAGNSIGKINDLLSDVSRQTSSCADDSKMNNLDPLRIRRIAEIVYNIQKIFGYPVDVEWALDEKGPVILQARPVTAIEAIPDPKIKWTRELTAERYPLPLSPLGWSNIRQVFDQGVRSFAEFMGIPLNEKDQLAVTWNGWVYANADAFNFREKFKIRLNIREKISLLKSFCREIISFNQPLKEIKSLLNFIRFPRESKTRLGNTLNSLPFAVATKSMLLFLRRTADEIRSSWPSTLSAFLSTLEKVDDALQHADTHETLFKCGNQLQKAMIDFIQPDLVIFSIKEISALCLTEISTLAGIRDAKRISALLGKGLKKNVTLDFNEQAREIGLMLAKEGWPEKELSQSGRQKADNFIRKYGHLSTDWDIMNPTWGERKDILLKFAFDARISKVLPSHSDDLLIENTFFQKLEGNASALAVSRELVEIMRTFMEIDEEHHFYMGKIVPPTRTIVLKLGNLLAKRKIIKSPELIFWLKDEEVRPLFSSDNNPNLTPLAISRKIAFNRAVNSSPPENLNFEKPENNSVSRSVNTMSGLPVSSGKAVGIARHVNDTAGLEKIMEGEIMITRSPNPSFTIAFSRIAGIVSETGGILSHGAVAAREYRLPAVFGIKKLSEVIPDGAVISIDGTLGFIKIIK
ncbi:MAG: hypothetical protein HQM10_24395 [Candidatus Riflebacteria bacterium]|nr:hypothetical protein [Candidatus Riflebacteria bacterium]